MGFHKAIKETERGTFLSFNYDSSSLISVWAWFEDIMCIKKKTEKEIAEELAKYSSWLHSSLLETDFKFTLKCTTFGIVKIKNRVSIIKNV